MKKFKNEVNFAACFINQYQGQGPARLSKESEGLISNKQNLSTKFVHCSKSISAIDSSFSYNI
jgi:hypothetical protein